MVAEPVGRVKAGGLLLAKLSERQDAPDPQENHYILKNLRPVRSDHAFREKGGKKKTYGIPAITKDETNIRAEKTSVWVKNRMRPT